jgi:hypothetical protein
MMHGRIARYAVHEQLAGVRPGRAARRKAYVERGPPVNRRIATTLPSDN